MRQGWCNPTCLSHCIGRIHRIAPNNRRHRHKSHLHPRLQRSFHRIHRGHPNLHRNHRPQMPKDCSCTPFHLCNPRFPCHKSHRCSHPPHNLHHNCPERRRTNKTRPPLWPKAHSCRLWDFDNRQVLTRCRCRRHPSRSSSRRRNRSILQDRHNCQPHRWPLVQNCMHWHLCNQPLPIHCKCRHHRRRSHTHHCNRRGMRRRCSFRR